jgi:hypothetical protein
MSLSKLTSARDYFDEVVTPAKSRFFAEDACFSTLYPMINGLFHLHEWIWFFHSASIESANPRITSAAKYWAEIVEKAVPDAGLIRDLNNVSKHVELDIKPRERGGPSRGAHHAANTEIIVLSSLPGGSLGGGSLSPSTATVKEGNNAIKLDPIAEELFKFWQTTIANLEPMTVTVNQSAPAANS